MIRIILIDDEHLIRSAIAGLLGLMDGMVVLGEYESGEEAIKQNAATEATVAIVDLQLPGMDGIGLFIIECVAGVLRVVA